MSGLFDIFEWACIVLGVIAGILFGWKQFGIIGGMIGAVAGYLGGFLLGRSPLFIGLQLLGIRRKSREELEAIGKTRKLWMDLPPGCISRACRATFWI